MSGKERCRTCTDSIRREVRDLSYWVSGNTTSPYSGDIVSLPAGAKKKRNNIMKSFLCKKFLLGCLREILPPSHSLYTAAAGLGTVLLFLILFICCDGVALPFYPTTTRFNFSTLLLLMGGRAAHTGRFNCSDNLHLRCS